MLHGSSAPPSGTQSRPRHGWAYILFLQNLFHLALPPAIGPTWSLAIEEQYYFLWAPVVRFLRAPWMLASLLVAALIASPLFRLTHFALDHADAHPHPSRRHRHGQPARSRPVHAADQPPSLALDRPRRHAHRISRRRHHRRWHRISRFRTDHALRRRGAFSIASTGARNPLNAILRRGPLAFYGRISYGLYMTHIMVFIYFGWFDARMDHYGIPGNLAVVAFRLAACTLAATCSGTGSNRESCALSATLKRSRKETTLRPKPLALAS